MTDSKNDSFRSYTQPLNGMIAVDPEMVRDAPQVAEETAARLLEQLRLDAGESGGKWTLKSEKPTGLRWDRVRDHAAEAARREASLKFAPRRYPFGDEDWFDDEDWDGYYDEDGGFTYNDDDPIWGGREWRYTTLYRHFIYMREKN